MIENRISNIIRRGEARPEEVPVPLLSAVVRDASPLPEPCPAKIMKYTPKSPALAKNTV